MRIDHLTEMQIDALRECGSIGAGHAATALSQLVGEKIEIDVPTLEMVGIGDVPQIFGGPESLVAAVRTRLLGSLSGSTLFMAERSAALAVVDLTHAHAVGRARSFGADEEAQFTHVATILISAYLAAIGRLADLNLLPARPSWALDMAGAIMQAVTSEAAQHSDVALLVRTRFHDAQTSADAYLFFLPDAEGLDVLLCRLGVA